MPRGPGSAQRLERSVGVGGAVVLGLGSILGAGVFVSIGLATRAAGPAVLFAILVAALVAACNGLSSAQLAASHPVSGGTYAYGYRYLTPRLGFAAGWLFLCAKSASAATAALGAAGYALSALGLAGHGWFLRGLALAFASAVTMLVLTGLRRSNRVNAAVVAVTVLALVAFVLGTAPTAWRHGAEHLWPDGPIDGSRWRGTLEACALMFVAYTGYGRVATMGEEIRDPRRSIPVAVVLTLVVSAILYLAVAASGLGAVGAATLGGAAAEAAERAAPLQRVALGLDLPLTARLVAVGAITAMLGVLLNLVLGLSRVVLAMARQGDMPAPLARLDAAGTNPRSAVVFVGVVVVALVLIGDVGVTWSFSAFTVLAYYALTNLAALRLDRGQRLFPRWVSVAGLVGCLGLAFWVDPSAWLAGLVVLGIGLVWHAARRARRAGRV